MNSLRDKLIASAILASIMFLGIASWSYLLTGDWPPQYLLISASIGGMLSPHLWSLIHRRRGQGRVVEPDPLESE